MKPHLGNPKVVRALQAGLKKFTKVHLRKKARINRLLVTSPYQIPYLVNPKNDPDEHFRAEDFRRFNLDTAKGSHEWYQPYRCCHFVAPFVLELVKLIYPDREWSILTSHRHSVVVNQERSIVFDLLKFENYTAEKSLAVADKFIPDDREEEFRINIAVGQWGSK